MFEHFGLSFTKQHIETARKNIRREPFKSAWGFLNSPPDLGRLENAYLDGLRYRAYEGKGGQHTVNLLHRLITPENASYLDILRFSVVSALCLEMVSDHPAMTDDIKQRWAEFFASQTQADPSALPVYEGVWLALLQTAVGVVMERAELFDAGTAFYKHIVDHDIHPQGYIQSVIDVKDGYMLHRFLITLQGLSLLAEIATNAGNNLWAYNNRGVSLVTAGLYPLYYYFYPEKWKWETLPPEEETKALFKQYGGFLEVMNFRIGRATRAIDLILADQRPFFDIYSGGLTTLTHAVRRGWFG